MDAAIEALIAAEALPADYADTVERVWVPLAAGLAARRHAAGRPLLVGINGVQGSGKTTACRFLELLLRRHGLAAATLSLDDVYLTRAERTALAARVHPLLATRGPPGTHDLGLADTVITRLLAGAGLVAIPRFDKATDDRAPTAAWPQMQAPLDFLLFEGWCIGATPQQESALSAPVNALEALEDAEMTWRRHVNTALATGYARLFERLDVLMALQAPDFDVVRGWRQLQEDRLRARAGAQADVRTGMDAAALDRFIQHYERLTRHMLASLVDRADITIPVDRQHRIGAIQGLDRADK
ncbi:MAG: kinase [Sandarakinorhabdus sp.]|nr:kinase [Sandarakinorhabdus sp.]